MYTPLKPTFTNKSLVPDYYGMYFQEITKDQDTFLIRYDIVSLLRQRQSIINRLGNGTLDQIAKRITPTSIAYKDLTRGLSDQQLVTMVKSHNLQRPSELKAWSTYLMSTARDLIDETESKSKEMLGQIKKADPVDSSSPDPAVDNN